MILIDTARAPYLDDLPRFHAVAAHFLVLIAPYVVPRIQEVRALRSLTGMRPWASRLAIFGGCSRDRDVLLECIGCSSYNDA